MAPSVELVRPSALFRDSYRGLVAEFTDASEKLIPFTLAFEHDDFEALLRRAHKELKFQKASSHTRHTGLCVITATWLAYRTFVIP
jgi:hypothetical protein